MQPVLTPTEMAAADAAAIAGGTPEAVLVHRAADQVARTARRLMGGVYGRRVVVVAGKGNNGADGALAAGILDRWGARTDVFRLADGIGQAGFERALRRADLAVDAMYGTGFRGILEGDAAAVTQALGAGPTPVLAVDIPSGVDGLTGQAAGPAVRATATVCFAALKPGLLFPPGSALAGQISVADIGIDIGESCLWVAEPLDVAGWLSPRPITAHKWSVGGLYVLGGSAGMTGAANLTSRAGLRAGAGIVICGLPGEAARRMSGGEVITRELPQSAGGVLDESAADTVLGGLERFQAMVVGPGLGTAPPTVAAVRRIVAEAGLPLLLDADGLNSITGQLDLIAKRTAPTVLTPHDGEYARLAGAPPGDDRVAAARHLAARCGAVVLLKGPASVIAAPDGRAAVNRTGGPHLATAGTGDVLSGIVGAFLARGIGAFEASVAGAYIHGVAGGGPDSRCDGLIAGDLIDALPTALSGG